MKLTPRFALVFIIYATMLLLGIGLFAYNSGQESLRATTISELEGTALRKETNLNDWIDGKRALIRALTTDPSVIRAASTLMSANPNTGAYRTAHEMFIASVQPRLATSEFLEVSLIDPNTGQVIASTSQSEEGTFREDWPYFLNGKNGPFVEKPHYSAVLQTIAMTAASPLLREDGGLLGVLAARLDLEGLNAIISRRTDLHETDEAYLVTTSNLVVTQPRLESDLTLLQNGIPTEYTDRCLHQESGVLETLDYRNVPSFVAYRWMPERELCLVVKIDQAEAYAPIRGFGETIAVISLLALGIAVALAITLARSMTRPILALQKGVTRFAQGELDFRLPETSKDELGKLAAEFNKMAGALAEQQTDLRRRAEQFFNLTLDLLCTIDSSGRLIDLNPAWHNTLGYRMEELRNQLLRNLIHPDDLAATLAALQQITATNVGRFENRCRDKDGNYRWLAWVVVLSAQDQLLYAAAHDITERRLGEEKLRQQTEELERSNHELEQFAHVASHDLQESLRLVTSNVQHLLRRYQGKLDKDADESIGFALDATVRMKDLISGLLAYSKAGSSRAFAPVMLEKTLPRVLDHLKLMLKDADAIVTHDPLPTILADEAQMVQLFQNLIENSIKFRSVEPPRIHIGVSQLGQHWLFFLKDNGIGIDPRLTERVFGLFQKFHSQDQYSGTGIGLAISRKIVERHGGRIWVDSEPGKGATFYFTLLPAEGLTSISLSSDIAKPPAKKTVVDRARDLI